MTKLLHVEDDLGLAELVQLSFQSFGFRGETLIATTVQEASEILADTARYPRLDLIVSDMNLPDGLGLDVVRKVRADPMRARVPVLILSGTTDQRMVDRAYALGANSYVTKGNGARAITDVVRGMYEHWLCDALLPRVPARTRLQAVLAKGIRLRTRVGELYARFSQKCDGDLAQSGFWMSLALRQGNLANLLTFLGHQLGDRDLSSSAIDQQLQFQRGEEALIDRIERALDEQPERSFEIARDGLIDLMSHFEPEAFVQVTGQLFPVVQTAVVALRQVVTRAFDEVIEWVETYGDSVEERRIEGLRAVAAHLHQLLDDDEDVHPTAT